MKDTDYKSLMEFQFVGGLIPVNERAIEYCDMLKKGEIVQLRDATTRDISFHRNYFLLLGFIYDYLPLKFKKKIPKEKFHIFLKHLKGSYDVLFEFSDGTKMVEYESISFGKMSQKTFEDYVRNQLPFIYSDVIGVFFEGDVYDNIIETIEEEFKKFLSKL